MNTYLYPPTPVNVDPRILLPSLSFKKNVGIVLTSIILFFIVYILLVLAAIALAVGCFYLGIWLVAESPRFFTIMICLGLIGLGISVFVFLIKFIFSVSKNVNDSRIEIKEKDQPELFSFITKLAQETKTPFPKKIFLSGNVNASVFYNSSFWSMFFPVRKNLEIGLGLVNSINVSEFKAVVAHEFGHFSQRSMKLGSFTYNVNQIIYNMLYDNKNYSSFLTSWARVSGYFAFFARITIGIAEGIQSILKQMYTFINKNYMSLSREMEFHADAVAASVSGGNNLVSALSRIEVADSCYTTALNKAEYWLKENKVSNNIFNNQLTIFCSLAVDNQLQLKNGLPCISYQFIKSFSQSRINYKNQWASHPSLEERKTHLEKLETNVTSDETSAWELFDNSDILQEQMTANLYRKIKLEENAETYDRQFFDDWYKKEKDATSLPSAYKGFYNVRYTDVTEWDIDLMTKETSAKIFDELFNEENGQLQSTINNNENDGATVKAIKAKQINIKTFDFDGVKYAIEDCDIVIQQLEDDITKQKQQQLNLDKEAFIFFYCNTGNKERLVNAYKAYQVIYKRYSDYADVANGIFDIINPFYESNQSIDNIKSGIQTLKVIGEKNLKIFFKKLLNEKIITPETSADLYNRIESFNNKNYVYFAFDSFQDEELKELSELVLKVADELNDSKYQFYKSLLEQQLEDYLSKN